MGNEWANNFTPVERDTVQHLVEVTITFEWMMYGISGLLAIFLFILAGHRSRQGDFAGAVLSCVGAIVCAIAPILAKNFI
jgi:hypothetical protein